MGRDHRRAVWASSILLLALTLAPPFACAGDEAKRDCRQGCEETQRSCKGDCGSRDSGDLEASQRWVDCDADCHDTYAACVGECAEDD